MSRASPLRMWVVATSAASGAAPPSGTVMQLARVSGLSPPSTSARCASPAGHANADRCIDEEVSAPAAECRVRVSRLVEQRQVQPYSLSAWACLFYGGSHYGDLVTAERVDREECE